MSTNKHSFGSVVLEIDPVILRNVIKFHICYTKIVARKALMKALNCSPESINETNLFQFDSHIYV